MPLSQADLHEFFALLDTHARDSGAGREPSRPVAVRFEIGNAGSWTLRAAPNAPGECVRDDEDVDATTRAPPDCTLCVSDEVLLDLANGRRKFAVAMLKGLISVKGDKTVFATELQSLFRAAMADFKARREAMRSNATPTGALRVVVHGASIVAGESHESYAVYLLEVFEGDQRWTLARRWSEVRALERRMRRARPAIAGVPTLPRSLDFAGSLERAFLARRATIIGTFLNDALQAIPTSVLLCTGASLALRLFLAAGDDNLAAPTPHHDRRASGGAMMLNGHDEGRGSMLGSPPSRGSMGGSEMMRRTSDGSFATVRFSEAGLLSPALSPPLLRPPVALAATGALARGGGGTYSDLPGQNCRRPRRNIFVHIRA